MWMADRIDKGYRHAEAAFDSLHLNEYNFSPVFHFNTEPDRLLVNEPYPTICVVSSCIFVVSSSNQGIMNGMRFSGVSG